MEKEELQSNHQAHKTYQAHTILRDRWNGRSGYTVYYIPVKREKVRDYIENSGIRLTPQCGDSISYIKEVQMNEELRMEKGTHSLTKIWKAPVKGCEVKIQRYSCD